MKCHNRKMKNKDRSIVVITLRKLEGFVHNNEVLLCIKYEINKIKRYNKVGQTQT